MPRPPAWVTAAASFPPAAEPIGASRIGCWMPSRRVSAVSMVAMDPPGIFLQSDNTRVGNVSSPRRQRIGDGRNNKVKLSRRRFPRLAASALALPALSRSAMAQTWPAQPVHVIVGYAAGQSIDILARLIGQSLSEQLGQQFVIENKPGAGGNIATEGVARAAPDGYTLLAVGANNPINSTLYDKLSFDLLRDFAPVAGIYRVYQVMVVNPTFPARTVAEFIAYAKANPGKINFGSAGTGSDR